MRWLVFSLFMVLAAATTSCGSESQAAEDKMFLHSRQVFGTIHFANGSAVLNESAQRDIDQIMLRLHQLDAKKHTIRIEGFATRSGTDEINVTISMMRAKAVVDYIRNRHTFESDLYLTGYGVLAVAGSSGNDKGRAEIAVYDQAFDTGLIVDEKAIIR